MATANREWGRDAKDSLLQALVIDCLIMGWLVLPFLTLSQGYLPTVAWLVLTLAYLGWVVARRLRMTAGHGVRPMVHEVVLSRLLFSTAGLLRGSVGYRLLTAMVLLSGFLAAATFLVPLLVLWLTLSRAGFPWAGLAASLLIAGALAFVFLGPGRPRRMMHVVSLGPDGEIADEAWHEIQEGDRYDKNGLAELGPYIDRLLAFEGWFASLMISSSDQQRVVSLFKREGSVTLQLIFMRDPDGNRVKEAKEFFKVRNLDIEEAHSGLDGTRFIGWSTPAEAAELTTVTIEAAKQLCGFTEDEGLTIRYDSKEEPPESCSSYG